VSFTCLYVAGSPVCTEVLNALALNTMSINCSTNVPLTRDVTRLHLFIVSVRKTLKALHGEVGNLESSIAALRASRQRRPTEGKS
jgi:hypothetical protein